MSAHGLGWLAVACYVGAEIVAIASLVTPRPRLAWLTPLLVGAGLALQFRDLLGRARALDSVPYRTLGGSVSLFGWMLGIAFLVLLLRHRERAIGPFLIPFVVVTTAVGLLLPDAGTAPAADAATHGALFALHVTLGILAYAAFTFSFVLSVLYLIQDRQLRRRRTGILFARLPALEVIGRMNRTSVTIGLATLAASLGIGLYRAEIFWQSLADPKIAWALITALVYGFLLWMERRGWEGPRVAVLSIVGFGVVMFSYTVVNVYLTTAHRFR
ncbi:MAG TPA: cytochrome c biogenesis protein CcsA [Thermoanaerobaculia bacterium]|nr:cytochrome c biogenesis protein CcsA [Thermoanaerobaculia bacterium]